MADAAGWGARIALDLALGAGRTVLVQKQQQGPLTVQRAFYPEGPPCHLYLLHPPGGVVGGDRLEIAVRVREGAHALLTAPGAAKFYRSAGAPAQLQQRFQVEEGAVLEWLPHESILFPGADVALQTEVALTGNARFIGWEILSLGRPVVDERFSAGRANIGLRLSRDGRGVLQEHLRLGAVGRGAGSPRGADPAAGSGRGEGSIVHSAMETEMALAGASGLRGWPITATLLAIGAGVEDRNAVRAALPAEVGFPIGVTLLDDLLVARALAHKVEPVLHAFRALWHVLRPRLLGLDASVPRIWAT